MKRIRIVACACCALVLLGAPNVALGQAVSAPWVEDFDSYNPGPLIPQSTWEGWNNDPAADALVVNSPIFPVRSDPHSVEVFAATDIVQQFNNVNSGRWELTGYWYVPANHCCGRTYFLVQNEYAHGGPYSWSVEVWADTSINLVHAELSGEELPLITDQWVEIRVEIDLDAGPDGTQDFYYGGDLLYSGPWIGQVSPTGSLSVASVNLYANNTGPTYFDDFSLVRPSSGCVGDLNGDGVVDLVDMAILLGDMGCTAPPPCIGDLDGDGDTDLTDLCVLMSYFGCTPGSPPPPPAPTTPPITTLVRVPNNLGPNSATYDLEIELPGDSGGWVMTAASTTTGAGTFFEHPAGGNGPPDPALFVAFPQLEFDSFYTTPEYFPNTQTTGDLTFAPSPVHTPTSRSAAWLDTPPIAGAGTWVVARYSIEDLPEERTTVTVDGHHCLYAECCVEYPFSLSVVYCPGDLDEDGDTDLADLGILLADFACPNPGNPAPCEGDVDGDGDTDLADLGIMLTDFGCNL